jgi:hypothetical protein
MWLFSSVDTLVNSKGRSLDELFTTVRVVTNVWPDTTVDAFWEDISKNSQSSQRVLTVASKIATTSKSFSAGRARKGLGWAVLSRCHANRGTWLLTLLLLDVLLLLIVRVGKRPLRIVRVFLRV